MKLISFLLFLAIFCCLVNGCSSTRKESRVESQTAERSKGGVPEETNDPNVEAEARERNAKAGDSKSKAACLSVDVGKKFPLKSQTFPIDFEPFRDSCFVTYHDPENSDPPIGSEIGIFKNGRKIYTFETRYHADAATCWVEAVSFQDLNADKLVDIIVVGKCGAKSGDMQGNEVFINTGKGFHTSVAANDKLEQFTKLKDIAEFVKKNKTEFILKG
ncbi:MAG: hypothetical protein HKN25_12290 [Pyrinomonadaceae bacterium]|nr:hypothetical protein [Pyrinomonadaceae bacterium]